MYRKVVYEEKNLPATIALIILGIGTVGGLKLGLNLAEADSKARSTPQIRLKNLLQNREETDQLIREIQNDPMIQKILNDPTARFLNDPEAVSNPEVIKNLLNDPEVVSDPEAIKNLRRLTAAVEDHIDNIQKSFDRRMKQLREKKELLKDTNPGNWAEKAIQTQGKQSPKRD